MTVIQLNAAFSIIMGVLILVFPQLLNYIIALYLIVGGLLAFFG